MPMPHTQRVWKLAQDVARNGPLANPRRLGPDLPPHLLQYKKVMPILFHGRKITFGDQVSEKGKNRTRRVWYPNVVHCSLYSRALDMRILTLASTFALRQMDYQGGLDEYLLKTSDELLPCSIAQMYRRKIKEAYQGLGKNGQRLGAVSQDLYQTLKQKYGLEYVR